MNDDDLSEARNRWVPTPPGWVHHERRVVARRAGEEMLHWFALPDPTGYDGIGRTLMEKTPGAAEFWMWTDESGDRTVRFVRLGYRRYVVELHNAEGGHVLEDPRLDPWPLLIADDEAGVLGHNSVSPAQTFSSSMLAESCTRLWLDHDFIHDGMTVAPWPNPAT